MLHLVIFAIFYDGTVKILHLATTFMTPFKKKNIVVLLCETSVALTYILLYFVGVFNHASTHS
jgi:hypothetical protein